MERIVELTDEDRVLLRAALTLLRSERAKAWNAACDAADAARKRQPSLAKFEIPNIKRLGRKLGAGPTHWMEER